MKQAMVTLANDGFMLPLKVMLHSFTDRNRWFKGDIIVLHSKEKCHLGEANRKWLSDRYENIKFFEVDESAYKPEAHAKAQNPRFSISYYTLEAFRFDKYDKVLFVDADMLVFQSIEEFMNPEWDFIGTINSPNIEAIVTPQIVPEDKFVYVNGGLFSLGGELLGKKIYEKVLQVANQGHLKADQDTINAIIRKRRYLVLPTRYNIMVKGLRDTSPLSKKIYTLDIKILHYAGKYKPWDNNKSSPYSRAERVWQQYYEAHFDNLIFNTTHMHDLSEEVRDKVVSVIGNGVSLLDASAERLNEGLLCRCNWFFQDTVTKINKDVWGYFFGIIEDDMLEKFRTSKASTKYVFSPNKAAKKYKAIDFWTLAGNENERCRKHMRRKKERGGIDLPTTGLGMLNFVALLQPKKLRVAGIDFYRYQKNDSYTLYGRKDQCGSPHTNNKPHSRRTDLLFLINACRIYHRGHIEVLGNEFVSSLVSLIYTHTDYDLTKLLDLLESKF